MHLIFYSPQSLPSIGGLQYVVHYWAVELALRGHTITILTDTDDYESGTPIPALPDGVKYLRKAGWWKQVRMMRNASRVVMFNISLKGLPLWVLAKALGGPKLFASHHTALWYDGGAKPIRQRLKQWAANRIAAANCACSAYIAAQYQRCIVVYSPVQVALFGAKKTAVRTRDILFAGRHVSDKGADLLIAALGILYQAGHNLHATFVGSGPETEALQQQAQNLGLLQNNKVVFTGSLSQPDLIRVLHAHRMMVVPSRMEPMGMVIAEGLAAGCQMIVARQGGMPEVGGDFCRYFTASDATSLAMAIQEELRHPTVHEPTMVKKHLEPFSIRYSVDKLEAWLGG
jgi:glycogen synthase